MQEGRKRLSHRLWHFRWHAVAAVLLFLGVHVVDVLTPDNDTVLLHLGDDECREMVKEDIASLYSMRANVSDLLRVASSSPLSNRSVRELSTTDRAMLRSFWSSVLTSSLELDALMLRYRAFYLVDDAELHDKAFMLAYGAFVTQLRMFQELSAIVDNRPFLETFLNEAAPEHGVPADSFLSVRGRLVHPDSLLRLHAGATYKVSFIDCQGEYGDLWQSLADDYGAVVAAQGRDLAIYYDHSLDVLERRVSRIFAPIQKGVAVRMSLLRVTDRPYLISGDLLDAARVKCCPGDILLERRSWHATNIGIPGFWPHAALYVGTREERRAMFGRDVDEEIVKMAPVVAGRLSLKAEDGHSIRVVEANRNGVILNSFEMSANADYLAILRPRASKEGKLRAISAALSHVDKPYDYNFDFATDGAMVCSELVAKAYTDVEGVDLMPTVVSGRLLLPANMIAQKYAEEAGKESTQLDFVAFVDSSEKRGDAWISDESNFRNTWQRPKWAIVAD